MLRRSPTRPALAMRVAGLLVLAASGWAAGRAAAVPIAPVAGLLPVTNATWERWAWSGRWRFPVGDPRDFRRPAVAREPAFQLLRGGGDPDEGAVRHQGADLGCGHGGEPVHAAASGLVLATQRSIGTSGYGLYVVLGHRLPEGGLAYSIYAHLAAGSIPVHPGQLVQAGRRIGRVGMSGRATTPHLHFEVRLAGAPDTRWEKEEVVDPIAFVGARTADSCATDSLADYVEWAQYAGLLDGAPAPEGALHRSTWWHMLAAATRQSIEALPRSPGALEDSLVVASLLPEGEPASPTGRMGWNDLARDLARARAVGLRLPVRPVETGRHRALCRKWAGDAHPLEVIDASSHPRQGGPSVATALLALADLAPAADPEKPAKVAKVAKVAKAAKAAKVAKVAKARTTRARKSSSKAAEPLVAKAVAGHRSGHAKRRTARADTLRTATGEVRTGVPRP